VTFDHDPGEGESYENKTLTQKWKGAGQDSVQAAFEVDENTTAGTYNVTLSIKPSGHGGTVTVDEAEVFDRTALGYGGAPTHQEPPPTQRKVGFDKMVLPTVSGLFANQIVHHAKDLPLAPTDGIVQFDSGWVAPQPLTKPFTDYPEAAQKLKVRIYYRLKKWR